MLYTGTSLDAGHLEWNEGHSQVAHRSTYSHLDEKFGTHLWRFLIVHRWHSLSQTISLLYGAVIRANGKT